MSSSSLMALLRGVVQARLPGAVASDAGKATMLGALLEQLGPAAIVEAGLALRGLSAHPVLHALASGRTPVEVLARWSRLERFGHTRHRTRALRAGPGPRVTVEHFALDGGRIDPLDDLFIWGVLIAVLERAGFTRVHACLVPPEGEPLELYAQGTIVLGDELPRATTLVSLAWAPDRRAPSGLEPGEGSPARAALAHVVRADLLRSWRVGDVARTLGISTRSLQRQLADEGTTFSERLHRTRIDAACALMSDPRLSLADIAFCVGFADQAHFSRLFHRYLDVPPSAYRELASSLEKSPEHPVSSPLATKSRLSTR